MPSTTVDHSGVPASTVARPPGTGRFRSNAWLTLCAVAFGLFMVQLDASVVAIANPEIGRDLEASTADLQWVTNSYLLALAATLILGGKLGDRFGRRTFYLVGVVGFAASSVAIGLSGSITGVIVFRALQGVFGGLLMPNTLGLLRAVFPPKRFGMAVGIWAMGPARPPTRPGRPWVSSVSGRARASAGAGRRRGPVRPASGARAPVLPGGAQPSDLAARPPAPTPLRLDCGRGSGPVRVREVTSPTDMTGSAREGS